MIKILESIIVILAIIYSAEKLYLIPFDISLDMKPNNGREATYLAKAVGGTIGCIDSVSPYDMIPEDNIYTFNCIISQGNHMDIHIFFDKKYKNKMLKSIKQKDYAFSRDNSYFAAGEYYIVCNTR